MNRVGLCVIWFLSFLAFFKTSDSQAQDPVFSQFYNSPVYLNPALIGEEEFLYLNFAYRNQWKSLTNPYSTYQASLIMPVYQDKHKKPQGHIGGVGMSFYGDKAGVYDNFKTFGGNASFAYNLQMSTKNINRLSFAVQAGFIHKSVDRDNLTWGEQYNPFIGWDNTVVPGDLSQIQNKTFLDITAGVFWRFYVKDENRTVQSLYAGYSAGHLNHPDESVLADQKHRLPVLHKWHAGVVFGLNEKAFISANVLTMIQDKVNQTNLGAFLSYKLPFDTRGKLENLLTRVGGWYRVQDAAIASIEFLTNNFLVGFSYDWNVTSLRYNNRGTGAFEVALGYRFYQPAAPKVRY